MTFTVRIRGAGSQLKLQDFECESCGPVEVMAPICDVTKCPGCGGWAEWRISAPAVHTRFVVTASHGKNDAKPTPQSMDTRPLAEGQSYTEWRKERKKMWEAERHKRVKELLS